ncbi:Type-1 restriction enzyme EcoKI specificity protein [Chryseobacterium sp. MOF25P]|uniref:restriction endonuclease subunit S n=1 Tax=unclassified Chryseobacterium TaxID=2593645 RepID=UPI000805DCF1|nr:MULTISPECIES: restriction endonuclease subunit S [unclassified Chryseobacterium]OBW40463.1 Type-1 restriction enzyme EcoKI specificity protein [Chryseobacterium sp. MOF25P]OBW47837.1 Type-1 restriction enzyme EcoKI specificity protein [Chryseobacterium sp. BGARF1]
MIEGYKNSELGFIPDDWQLTELRDVAKCTVGIATSTTHAYCDNGVILLRNQNIKEGKIALNDVLYISPEFDELNKSKRLRENDIITVRTGYPGVSAVVPKELEGSQSFTTLIIRLNEQKPLSNFLCYYINSEKGKTFFTSNQAGGGQQNVGTKTLERMKIPLPPLPEQQKIAEILSTVDDKIEIIDQQITETQALKKGLMQRLLTKGIGNTKFKDSPLGMIPENWEVLKLSEICDEIFLGLTSKVDYVESGGFPFVRATDINSGRLSFENIKYISEKQHKKLTVNRLTKKGDVLVSKSGTLGTCAIVDVDTEFSTYESIITIQPKVDLLLNKFLLQILQDTNVQKRMIGARVGGIVGHLNLMTFRKLMIPLPKIEEQLQISDLLSTLDEKLEILLEKKTHYQELKQGLMQQLLTGKIRVKV